MSEIFEQPIYIVTEKYGNTKVKLLSPYNYVAVEIKDDTVEISKDTREEKEVTSMWYDIYKEGNAKLIEEKDFALALHLAKSLL